MEGTSNTLKITWPEDSNDVEHGFTNKAGDAMIVGSYVVDTSGNFVETVAFILTPQ